MADSWSCLLLMLAVVLCLDPASAYDWQWKKGRATYYGADQCDDASPSSQDSPTKLKADTKQTSLDAGTDAWSIHKGSCGYGALWKDEPHGWDVAAMTDYHPDYTNSCGMCIEVRCNQDHIKDNYGLKLDRTYSCYDTSQSVVVRITDTCPCTYPANDYSNKRWCCGDMDHLDVSVWAFEKLADTKWGVIGIEYRPVPCDHKPDKPAPAIGNPSPFPFEPNWGESDQKKHARDWPEFTGERARQYIYHDGYLDGKWWDRSWNTWVKQPVKTGDNADKPDGMRNNFAYCATVHNKGAISFKTNPGAFQDKYKLEFWVYVGVAGWEGTAAKVPNIQISIRGTKGQCEIIKIYDVKPDAFEPLCQNCADYYWRFTWYLPYFAGEWTQKVFNKPSKFKGCGGNGVWDLNEIQFRSDWGGDQWVCLDKIALV